MEEEFNTGVKTGATTITLALLIFSVANFFINRSKALVVCLPAKVTSTEAAVVVEKECCPPPTPPVATTQPASKVEAPC
jgi:hypothetical protein